MTEITDNQGCKTCIAYDLLYWEIRRTERDGGEGFQFTYDAEGRVLTVVSPEAMCSRATPMMRRAACSSA
ncbi:hypothetical protein B5F35_17700 [Anaeromassilibacillus sp. An200]|nr:hypothetical protein B5F35_17700 [Anaeromassilibacillus sp. An200]